MDMKRENTAEKVVRLLSERGWHITFAESCTGGLAASRLVDVPSASAVFDGSFVTYANEAKQKYLGVKADAISRCGVVSEEVAVEMARGAAAAYGAQVAVGISGIAGPSGGTAAKPVGTVCFGFLVGSEIFSATRRFGSIGRDKVRESSVDFVYDTLAQRLEK
jgi:nicotinamide-nucleotide amidase